MADMFDKYAIIIGISSYEDEIPNLRYTNNDAIRLAKILSQKSNYQPNRIYLITDTEKLGFEVNLQKPTRSNILNVIDYVSSNANLRNL